ncbi:MAG: universal stress protein [Anaerolineae bacterium]|jgi:nucleotide-binding universal stress UspA family protein
MRMLLCTGGSPHGQAALRFGAILVRGSAEPATLLGVAEHPEDRAGVERALREGEAWLAGAPVPRTLARARIKVRVGQAAEQILEEIASGEYDLVVVGTRGRHGITRFLLGSTAERITRQAEVPVLLVQGNFKAIERIVVCTAGGEPGLAATELAGRVARLARAHVTVLHVMSQLPGSVVPPHTSPFQVMPQTPAPHELSETEARDLDATAEQLMSSDTWEGKHLREALAILADMEVPAEARVRHGLVLDEIVDELREGDYALVVVGSRPVSGWMRFLLSDVSQQIIGCTDRPVLVARTG